ncbi:uncharacterized protein LOC113330424 [Papaver somniferum]|uniref:uncharacterized protein LOC113330424 n=1 Tax=Papaver somniferum TaxID=3469 RepID=UPI000E701E33|nr:uncharacterized protein LOC113330424 [Papaver somniferum]
MLFYLGDYQFGVGVPVGGEGILHAVNGLMELKGHSDSMSIFLIDFSNAFNMVSRSCLIQEVRLHCTGDPLGTLLFALTLHPLVKSIASRCMLYFHAWYLDDGTIIGDSMDVAKALSISESEGPSRGLHLNIKKTEVFWPTPYPRSMELGVFPPDIDRTIKGVKLLCVLVSLDLDFMSDMALHRVNKTIQLMSAIKKLRDPQSEMLLLRNCVGVSRLYFSMFTTNPTALHQASDLVDNHLFQYLRLLITGDGAGFSPLQQILATLPIKDGGLGIYTMEDTNTYCYLASQSQTTSVRKTILGRSFSDNGVTYQLALQNFIQVCGLPPSHCVDDTAPFYAFPGSHLL